MSGTRRKKRREVEENWTKHVLVSSYHAGSGWAGAMSVIGIPHLPFTASREASEWQERRSIGLVYRRMSGAHGDLPHI